MPIRRINFTGRRRLTKEDVEIRLDEDARPPSFEVTRLSLQRHNLAENAQIWVEAYRQSTYMRFPLGTISQPTYTGSKSLGEFNSPEGILFRVKVTSPSNPAGQLLAEIDKIRPEMPDGERESLLPVRRDDSLEHEVFRVDFEDRPVLLINGRLSGWKEISTEPGFVALAYPNVLRTILTRILLVEEHIDDMDDDDWRSQWLRFARSHPGIGEVPTSTDDSDLEQWIEQVLVAFCKSTQIRNKFSWHWNEGENS